MVTLHGPVSAPIEICTLNDSAPRPHDRLRERHLGVTAADGPTHLTKLAVRSFAELLLAISRECGSDITRRTTTEMAARLTVGLLSPLSSQLDPMRIGETVAARATAACYGQRLLEHGGSINRGAFARLTPAYPSPDFVVDREEAQRLFGKVRAPTPNEALLTEKLGVRAGWPADWLASGDGHAALSSTERPDNRARESRRRHGRR